MRFKPVSSEVADANNGSFAPWPAGEYNFEVTDAEDTESKSSGMEMIKLTLTIFDREGKSRKVFDYLTGDDRVQWKVRHFAEATGLVKNYEMGDLEAHHCQSRQGLCRIRIRPARDGYDAQNQVGDYIPAGELKATASAPRKAQVAYPMKGDKKSYEQTSKDLDDSIPF